jgi:hypothetical protein
MSFGAIFFPLLTVLLIVLSVLVRNRIVKRGRIRRQASGQSLARPFSQKVALLFVAAALLVIGVLLSR